MSLTEELSIPDEKNYVDWQLRVRKISMFEVNSNDLKLLLVKQATRDRPPTAMPRQGTATGADHLCVGVTAERASFNLKETASRKSSAQEVFGTTLGIAKSQKGGTPLSISNLEQIGDKSTGTRKAILATQGAMSDAGSAHLGLEMSPEKSANQDGDERGTSKKKSFYRYKTSNFKPILKQSTFRNGVSIEKSKSPSPIADKKVKFHKTKSVLRYNPQSRIGKQKSLKK